MPTFSQIFQALSGRHPATGDPDPERGALTSSLIAAYGTSKRDPSRPNVKAAAKGLGVSERTVQRWITTKGTQQYRPRIATLTKLKTKARQAETTKRGRARAIKQMRAAHPRGIRVTLAADQGVSADYARHRTVTFDLDNPTMSQAFFDAYENGGDAGALSYLTKTSDESYGVSSWWIGSIDHISIQGPYGI